MPPTCRVFKIDPSLFKSRKSYQDFAFISSVYSQRQNVSLSVADRLGQYIHDKISYTTLRLSKELVYDPSKAEQFRRRLILGVNRRT